MDKREFVIRLDEQGKFPDSLKSALQDIFARFPGKQLKLVISLYRRRRSNPQNAFYFGVVVPLVRQMFIDAGNQITPEETHYYIKKEIWRHIKKIKLPNGETKEVVDTSTKLTTSEWEDNLEKTRVWAAEFGLELPYPNET